MKNVRSMVLATITMLFMGMANIHAQENGSKTVIIRAFENFNVGSSSFMQITSPDGLSKLIDLNKLDFKKSQNNSNNSLIIQTKINYWKNQGYTIAGLSSAFGGSSLVTIIILSKDE